MLNLGLIRGLVRRARLIREYWYDYGRMVRHSSAVRRGDSRDKLKALIIMHYHGLEKGLSLPQPRGGFGRGKVSELVEMMGDYVRTYGADSAILSALNALRAYLEFNDQAGVHDDGLREKVDEVARLASEFPAEGCEVAGGCRKITGQELLEAAQAPFEQFAQLRYSVRQFSDRKVDLETIRSAIGVAQKTPSVCNRQSWRVWVVSEADRIRQILEIGGGARGFEDQIKVLLVVTSDLSCFQSPGERNQCWIDGGMFGMSLVYALHAKGLASCCMNWSKVSADDLRLRRLMGIPGSECIIFLVGVGHPRDEFMAAVSTRRPLNDVIRYWGEPR